MTDPTEQPTLIVPADGRDEFPEPDGAHEFVTDDTVIAPAPAPVAIGYLTILGTVAGALAALAAALAAVLQGDHTPETIAALFTAGGVIFGVIRERGRQSAARIVAASPAPITSVILNPPTDPAALGIEQRIEGPSGKPSPAALAQLRRGLEDTSA